MISPNVDTAPSIYPQPTTGAPATAPAPQTAQQGIVIPDCTTMTKQDMKGLRDHYHAQAKPHEQIIVAGELWYPRITSFIEGKELEEENKRRMMMGLQAQSTPFFRVRVNNPHVILKHEGAPTAAELYVMSLFAMSNGSSYQGPFFSRESRISRLPYIAVATDKDAKTFEQVFPKDEPASGTPAMIVLNTYTSGMRNTVNIAVNGVLICDPDVSFAASAMQRDVASLLANYGITLVPKKSDEPDRFDPASPEAQAMREMTADMSRDFPTTAPAPAQQPVLAPAPAPVQPAAPAYPATPSYSQPAARPAVPWGNGYDDSIVINE